MLLMKIWSSFLFYFFSPFVREMKDDQRFYFAFSVDIQFRSVDTAFLSSYLQTAGTSRKKKWTFFWLSNPICSVAEFSHSNRATGMVTWTFTNDRGFSCFLISIFWTPSRGIRVNNVRIPILVLTWQTRGFAIHVTPSTRKKVLIQLKCKINNK